VHVCLGHGAPADLCALRGWCGRGFHVAHEALRRRVGDSLRGGSRQRANRGHGKVLLKHSEEWLVGQGVRFLQVKTVAHTSKNAAYGETRKFYAASGFTPLEVFPLLWAPQNPALQLIKALHRPLGQEGGPS
jgi:GNAT superfamily N-acetyltransferase